MIIKTWRVHPKASRIEKAEKTCKGAANKGGVQWCGPYSNANKLGFWLYSPIEIDFNFDGQKFHINHMEEYGSEDYEKVKSLIRPSDGSNIEKWCFPGVGRTKTTMGLVEENVFQIWTGLIFETPPGWCLHIKNPINFPSKNFSVMEGILETDWMQYDIWVNLVCQPGRIKIEKNAPIAQLIPTRRESFKSDWEVQSKEINREDPDSEKAFKYWLDYNKQKFEMGGNQALTETLKKDSTTYFRERNRMLGRGMEPNKISGCPFAKNIKSLEEDIMEFKNSKPVVEFYPVFHKDKTKELEIIGNHEQQMGR